MYRNFAAVKQKPLKLPKITYFVMVGNVFSCVFMNFFENLTKQKHCRATIYEYGHGIFNLLMEYSQCPQWPFLYYRRIMRLDV